MEEKVLGIKEIGEVLKKHFQLIIVLTLATVIISIVTTYFIVKPTYKTTASILVGKKTESGSEYNSNDVQMYQKLMGTYAEVVKSKDLINRAIEKGNLEVTYEQIVSRLVVSTSNTNQILTLTYNSIDRYEGVKVLDSLIEEFSKTSNEIISNGELFVLTTPDEPKSPASPNKKLNIAIGIITGPVLGIILAILMDYFDDTIKSKEDIEKIIDVPVIGNVPNVNENSKK
ncbi:MAG: Wzz/FepE/Etk N-terminal domain-containing protein [Clostridium sp.]|nr:Wzz/FepE/Etk N-terminal domain-containing protein [Clostridium sp.]